MDLNYSPEEAAFRGRGPRLDRRQPTRRAARPRAELSRAVEGRPAALAQDAREEGLDRAPLAEGMGGHRLDRRAALHLRGGVRRRGRSADRAVRRPHVRAGAAALRHRRAEAALPAPHVQRRGLLGAGLLRAGRGLRPRVAQDPRRPRGRTTTSSPARRSGRRSATTATGSSASCAPTRRPRSARTASRSCSST